MLSIARVIDFMISVDNFDLNYLFVLLSVNLRNDTLCLSR